MLNLNIDQFSNSSPFKNTGGFKFLQNIRRSDFEKETILNNLELKQDSYFDPNNKQTFKPKKYPQNVILVPIIVEEKPAAFVSVAKYSTERLFTDLEEQFISELTQLLENFLHDQCKTANSLSQLTSKLQKSKVKSSKMKAYEAILFTQNIRPEYTLYKTHKTLQSFLHFLESTFTQLLSAQSTRILLFNETRQMFYHYPSITSTHLHELPHSLNSSITGFSFLTTEPYIFPPAQKTTETLDSYLSFRSPSLHSKSANRTTSFQFEYPHPFATDSIFSQTSNVA
jgi:hypothetical protein